MKHTESVPMRAAPPILCLILRYYTAFTLLEDGFAKLMGVQFTLLDSEPTKPRISF
jgi:hypothetical protein